MSLPVTRYDEINTETQYRLVFKDEKSSSAQAKISELTNAVAKQGINFTSIVQFPLKVDCCDTHSAGLIQVQFSTNNEAGTLAILKALKFKYQTSGVIFLKFSADAPGQAAWVYKVLTPQVKIESFKPAGLNGTLVVEVDDIALATKLLNIANLPVVTSTSLTSSSTKA